MAKNVDISGRRYQAGIDEEKFKKGVNAVTKNPAAQAVEQKERFSKNTLAGKDELIKHLQKTTLSEWKEATKKAFFKMQEKCIRAVETGKWNATKVHSAAKKAADAVKDKKKGTLEDSYIRYIAAQNAIKEAWK